MNAVPSPTALGTRSWAIRPPGDGGRLRGRSLRPADGPDQVAEAGAAETSVDERPPVPA